MKIRHNEMCNQVRVRVTCEALKTCVRGRGRLEIVLVFIYSFHHLPGFPLPILQEDLTGDYKTIKCVYSIQSEI